MSLTIPDELLRAAQMSAEEFRLERALGLSQQGQLTRVQAAQWAGLTRLQFQRELAQRDIPIHYDETELQRDWETVRRLRQSAQHTPNGSSFRILTPQRARTRQGCW